MRCVATSVWGLITLDQESFLDQFFFFFFNQYSGATVNQSLLTWVEHGQTQLYSTHQEQHRETKVRQRKSCDSLL